MPHMADFTKGYTPSFMDLVNDPDSSGTRGRSGYSEADYLYTVRRDLEDLLNTRRPSDAQLGIDRWPEVASSVIAYGVPDMSDFRFLQSAGQAEVCRLVAHAIELFEPRLRDVEVRLRDTTNLAPEVKKTLSITSVYFHISARLAMDPSPPVAFETVLELTKARTKVDLEGMPAPPEGDW